jgi:hypothetical protein
MANENPEDGDSVLEAWHDATLLAVDPELIRDRR